MSLAPVLMADVISIEGVATRINCGFEVQNRQRPACLAAVVSRVVA